MHIVCIWCHAYMHGAIHCVCTFVCIHLCTLYRHMAGEPTVYKYVQTINE